MDTFTQQDSLNNRMEDSGASRFSVDVSTGYYTGTILCSLQRYKLTMDA